MKTKFFLLLIFLLTSRLMHSQGSTPPIETSGYTQWTSFSEMQVWLDRLTEIYAVEMRLSHSTKSVDVPVVVIPSVQNDALSVMIIAEQHGDEPSGMEASLLIIRDLLNGQLPSWTDSVEWIIIPMANPEAHELKMRNKKNGADLNLDHSTLIEPETQYLHQVYNKYQPDVLIDIQELALARGTNEQFYERKVQQQIGCVSNLNLKDSVLDNLIHEQILPFVDRKLSQKKIYFSECILGDFFKKENLRYSLVNIDDARHGIGAMGGSISFVVAGMKGQKRDDNIYERVSSQYECVKSLCQSCFINRSIIQERVASRRVRSFYLPESVSIRMRNVSKWNNQTLVYTNKFSGKDTFVNIGSLFLDSVQSEKSISTPLGYWIPKDDKLLMQWVENHEKGLFPFEKMEQVNKGTEIKHMFVQMVAKIPEWTTTEVDGVSVPDWDVQWTEVQNWREKDYIFVSTNTINGLRWVMTLEPNSMFSLLRYPQFAYLRRSYPILRVISQ